MQLRSINALTLCTTNMARSVSFYAQLGLIPTFGGSSADFTTMSANAPVTPTNNALHVNLVHAPSYRAPPAQPGVPGGWGRAVFFVDSVDELHERLTMCGVAAPEPRDAPWGERYFHLLDPDGHELSFATPVYTHPRWNQDASGALGDALEELRTEQRRQGMSE